MATKLAATSPTPPAADPEVDRLLERARRGDPDAWRGLVDRFRRLVYSIPYRYRLGEEEAGDVFVATFGALHRDLDRIENGRSLPSWLATVAARESLRVRRLGERNASVSLEDVVAHEDAVAEREAVGSDDAYQVRAAMERLAPKCRSLLEALYDGNDPSYGEIASRLGIPVGAIGPTRSRCLDKLRKILESRGFTG